MLKTVVLLAFACSLSHTQTSEKRLAFDAASIKPVAAPVGRGAGTALAPNGGGFLRFTPAGVSGTRVTTERMVLAAYNLRTGQLAGAPAWLESDWFALQAKAETTADESRLRLMLQTLLADRFKLVAHHETRELPVYSLTVSKNGPKLHELKAGELIPTDSKALAALGMDRPTLNGTVAGTLMDHGTIPHFLDVISGLPDVDRPVVDRTGLKGDYILFLQWDTDGRFLDEVGQQLGFKFVAEKAQVDVLVIDHIEKPDAN
jgi:uncharacterized protein (TIGR03435 family)